jgi:hypothetical protein
MIRKVQKKKKEEKSSELKFISCNFESCQWINCNLGEKLISGDYRNLQILPSESNNALTQLWKADVSVDQYSYRHIISLWTATVS